MANSKKGTKQVNPPAPKQQVIKTFGGKTQLVDAIIGMLGDAPEGTRGKLMQASNSKLISHHHNTTRMVKDFGSKDGVVTAILATRFPKGAPQGEREKLEPQSPWRLMDLHRQSIDGAKRALVTATKAKAAKLAKAKRHGRTPAAAATTKTAVTKKK